jgi:hypothetical protein
MLSTLAFGARVPVGGGGAIGEHVYDEGASGGDVSGG